MGNNAYNKPPPVRPNPVGYYGRTDCVGSSFLSSYIDSVRNDGVPDRAAAWFPTSKFMEGGHIWESFVQEQITGESVFSDNYYYSNYDDYPSSKKRLPIPEIMNKHKVSLLRAAVKEGLIWNEKKDKDGKHVLRDCAFNGMLEEIKKNKFKKPVPLNLRDSIGKAWKNFQKYVFTDEAGDPSFRINLVDLLKTGKWQHEHFWNEDGIKCRAKFDVWAAAKSQGGRRDFSLDLKWTSCIKTFKRNFKKTLWQSIHYETGFRDMIKRLFGSVPDGPLYFVVTENKAPYMTYMFWLDEGDFIRNDSLYYKYLSDCWQWLQAKKPLTGWIKPRALDSYGRNVNKT